MISEEEGSGKGNEKVSVSGRPACFAARSDRARGKSTEVYTELLSPRQTARLFDCLTQ